jgi:hypothetical protein
MAHEAIRGDSGGYGAALKYATSGFQPLEARRNLSARLGWKVCDLDDVFEVFDELLERGFVGSQALVIKFHSGVGFKSPIDS